ncbi:erythromycin esterase family protein [Stigmatella sp. ncwal1]|uniref:Erythromycin esterase family protein n=1 Tax=Stigmatella ashevillensis TaxID=2995309 RepID=A0ABT5DEN3_9BACT|nr:erythromycin esterase family protein [Stigmatella ashevillena]MDC0712088.1 erythromycin esterase family protein [Stigmatella ashevillena]
MRIHLWLWLSLGLGCASARALHPGQVLGADGAAIPGARITVVPRAPSWDVRTDAPVAITASGPEGRFEVASLPPGEYGLSAVTPGGVLIVGESLQVKEGQPVKPLAIREGRDTLGLLEGTVVDEAGVPVPGAKLRIIRQGMPFDDVALMEASPEGRFQVRSGGGAHSVVASAPGFSPVMQRVARTGEPVTVRLERAADETMYRAAVTWMKETGVPLKSVEAGQGLEDLAPLKQVLKDTRVVALGEATHGTREFFQLKHCLLEFLVTELGFTVFALEENFAEGLSFNEYLLEGRGDPKQLLRGSAWDTEELLSLLQWMRRYNEEPAHPKKLKFYGVDMQFSPEAVARVNAYLAKVDAAHGGHVQELLAWLALPKSGFSRLPVERQKEVAARLDLLAERFEAERARYVRQSSEAEWAVARRNVRVLRQFVGKVLQEEEELRDRAMAENLLWILEHEGPDTRAVLWAHNGHVQRGPGEWRDRPMGRHLADALGKSLYVFGMAFHKGEFLAFNMDAQPPPGRKGRVAFSVPPEPEDTLDAALAATGWPLLALDLRALPRRGPAYEWWRRSRRAHDIGFIYSDGGYPSLGQIHALALYDGLLFVERTTAARLNPR